MLTIRPATPADAQGIASVHVASWQSTYRGIVPEAFLDALSVPKRADFWSNLLSAPPSGTHLFVAVAQGGQVVGFSSGGANRSHLPYDAEVMAIYLLQGHQRQGIGKRLFQASINQLADDGHQSLIVWALEQNPSCGFYTSMGGRPVADKLAVIGGKDLKELAFAWEKIQTCVTAQRVYHITDARTWAQALQRGVYEPHSLTKEGFIHCSDRSQLLAVAQRYFQNQRELLVLELDVSRLSAALRYENTSGGTELFPHLYGPMNLDAVLIVRPFACDQDGAFRHYP